MNTINFKIYIGSSKDIYSRWYQHKNKLRSNDHHSRHLQNAWNLYGEDSFVFEIIEEVKKEKDLLLEKEQYYLDFYKSYKSEIGYNVCLIAHSCLGVKRSEKTREKISQAAKASGRWKGENNPFYGISLTGSAHGMFGKMHTVESRKKISKNHADVSATKNPRAKLDWEKIRHIRSAYKNGELSVKEMMSIYSVGQSTIYNILYHNTWKE